MRTYRDDDALDDEFDEGSADDEFHPDEFLAMQFLTGAMKTRQQDQFRRRFANERAFRRRVVPMIATAHLFAALTPEERDGMSTLEQIREEERLEGDRLAADDLFTRKRLTPGQARERDVMWEEARRKYELPAVDLGTWELA